MMENPILIVFFLGIPFGYIFGSLGGLLMTKYILIKKEDSPEEKPDDPFFASEQDPDGDRE